MDPFDPDKLTRRQLLRVASAGAGLFATLPAWAIGPGSRFRIARLVLPGLEDDIRPGASARLVWEVLKRTSINADMDGPALRPDSPNLFEHPFLTLFGDRGFADPPESSVATLRRHLSSGGFLLADSCGGRPGDGFDRSFRRLMRRCLPETPLKRLAPGGATGHTVYRSFYLLERPHGRLRVKPHLEGCTRDDRSMVVYSQNDLPGAWARDSLGGWLFDMPSGGERERELRVPRPGPDGRRL